MITLTAIRLDAYERFQFRIETPGMGTVVTADAATAADALRQLGVQRPEVLIEHVRRWGQVEIPQPQSSILT